jgi:hypothetical protein
MGAMHINAKEVMYITEVTHRELMAKRCDDGVEESGGVGGEDDIIYIQEQICSGGAILKNEQRGVTLGSAKTNGGYEGGEAMKPCPWRLFEALKGLVEVTHM